jgi:hypothetical protein
MIEKVVSLGFDMGMGALKLWSKPGGLQLVSQVASNGHGHLSDGILGLKNRKRPMLVAAIWIFMWATMHRSEDRWRAIRSPHRRSGAIAGYRPGSLPG